MYWASDSELTRVSSCGCAFSSSARRKQRETYENTTHVGYCAYASRSHAWHEHVRQQSRRVKGHVPLSLLLPAHRVCVYSTSGRKSKKLPTALQHRHLLSRATAKPPFVLVRPEPAIHLVRPAADPCAEPSPLVVLWLASKRFSISKALLHAVSAHGWNQYVHDLRWSGLLGSTECMNNLRVCHSLEKTKICQNYTVTFEPGNYFHTK
jgi:hypothetical protein